MSNLSLEKLYKVYPGDVLAVKDFDLEIEDKEFIVFVGPSGCGKSTTLRMIAGLEEITSGTLKIDGKVVNDIPPKDRDIAMVFQNYALYPHMTVYDNMAFGSKFRKLPKEEIEASVNEAARILDIEDLLKRKPKALSGGQRQRVALGRAIVRKPKVFLMDEPLSNLDAKLRVQMRTEISLLHERLQTTFVYVTHDQTEAMTMGTRIVVMHEGVVQQVDTPQVIYAQPVNMFVAGFIGSPQMNFFNATISKENDKYLVLFNGDTIRLSDKRGKALEDKGYLNKEVVFGIRPEDIDNHELFIEAYKESVFKAKVKTVEYMGAETIIYLIKSGVEFVVKVNGTADISSNDEITLALDSDKIHIFDKETEESITFD